MTDSSTSSWYKGIYYQGWWVNGDQQWRTHAFRSPGSGKRKNFSYHRPPVRGGRWKIRRVPTAPYHKPWRAWSEGKAKQWGRRFATHAEAYIWAHTVAEQYRLFDDVQACINLGLILRHEWEGRDPEPDYENFEDDLPTGYYDDTMDPA